MKTVLISITDDKHKNVQMPTICLRMEREYFNYTKLKRNVLKKNSNQEHRLGPNIVCEN